MEGNIQFIHYSFQIELAKVAIHLRYFILIVLNKDSILLKLFI